MTIASVAVLTALLSPAGLTGCDRTADDTSSAAATAAPAARDAVRHAVRINSAGGTPTVDTGRTDYLGRPVSVACSTCHAVREPNAALRSGAGPELFHADLIVRHGDLTCLSCHNANDYDTLRLADGRPLAFEQAMTLCAQCHGPQKRDYDHGSHGGMTGYWDLTRGERQRNHCVNCHDPHAPAYPKVRAVFKPVDPARQPAGEGSGSAGDPNGGGHG